MLKFDKNFEPNTGNAIKVAQNITRITAPNASPFTFKGTNCFIIGDKELAILDPGPNDENHLSALLKAINGRKVKAILLTHTHKDHSSLAKHLSAKINAPIWFGGKHRLSRPKKLFEVNILKKACDWKLEPDRIINNGEILKFGNVEIEAIATPGHCANHFSYAIKNTKYIFTGDHIMGWNSTLIATPDGSLSDYFSSLEKLIKNDWDVFLPAHGGAINNARIYATALREHRKKRNQQILTALKNSYLSIDDLLNLIYPSHSGRTRFAARLTLKAHLEYLIDKGEVASSLSLKGWKFDTNL